MRKRLFLRVALGCLALGMVFGVSTPASADTIDPGFDLFHTPDSTVFLDFGPGIGEVAFESNPIGPGDTDTIVERTSGLGDGETGTISIELVALSLVSVGPINLFDLGIGPDDGSTGHFFVELDTHPVSAEHTEDHRSLGEMEIITHGEDGGTFDSFFDVFTVITLRNDADDAILMTIEGGPPDHIETPFEVVNEWSHTAPDGYPVDPEFPAGNFYPGPTEHTGPHPETVPAVIPEPGTLLLLGMGLVGVGARARKKREKGTMR